MNWNTKVNQRKIGQEVTRALKALAPKRVCKTYLVYLAMKTLRESLGKNDSAFNTDNFTNTYDAVVSYIDSNTGKGKLMSFKMDGVGNGYALKSTKVAKKATKKTAKKGKRA